MCLEAAACVDINRSLPCCCAELSIQPQLNSTLIPPHARAQTTPTSHADGSVSDCPAQPSSAPGPLSNST
ncbi:glycogen synthase kinase-3 alpha isoform X1 [Arapaima gigas]